MPRSTSNANAMRFFRAFERQYPRSKKVIECYRKKSKRTAAEWTRAMDHVIRSIAKKFGFKVRTEVSRVDYVLWRETQAYPHRTILAIEHENWHRNVLEKGQELDKLLVTDADLRVLITYLARRDFKEEYREKMAERMENHIEQWLPEDRRTEFLLLLASRDWKECPREEPWLGYIWHRRSGKLYRRKVAVGQIS
jgi:hypothetical protein